MQTVLFQDSKIEVCQVLFNLPKTIDDIIIAEKQHIISKYGDLKRSRSHPHCSLCEFPIIGKSGEVIDSLVDKLKVLSPIEVNIDGYEATDNKMLWAKFSSSTPFQPFYEAIKNFRIENIVYAKKKNFGISDYPHVTLAQVDNSDNHKTLKDIYTSKSINQTFTLKELVVRKSNDSGKTFKTIMQIQLK
jgi:2'-5' RNA ligase